MKAAVGFDLGSSHITGAVVDENGHLLTRTSRSQIWKKEPAQNIVDVMAGVISGLLKSEELPAGCEIVGCGGGAPGPMNMDTGFILDTPNLVTLRQFPLAKALSEKVGLPVRINNDANLIVLGEALAGAGKGYHSVYGCTLGGGFGHGWVIDGRIHVGQHFFAMEHAPSPIGIEEGDPTIEDMVSNRGIVKMYREVSGEIDQKIDPEIISELAKGGNISAQQTYVRFGRYLALALCWIQNSLDPDVILVGGNIAKAWEHFSPSMTAFLGQHTWRDCNIPVLPMELGESAGIIGGGLLAMNKA